MSTPHHAPTPPLLIDRIACTGHGVCAQILPEAISLDSHGYPILTGAPIPQSEGGTAITMCPARALYWQGS